MQIHPRAENGPTEVRVGDRVRVRKQPWLVVSTEPHPENHRLFTLTGIGGHNLGLVRRVFAPFDRVDPLDGPSHVRHVGTRSWRRRFVQALIHDGPWGTLRAALHAQMDLLPHQLEPTIALLQGLSSRILLADAVGLGKTIQAGLAIAELIATGAAERILILSPAGLRDQWQSELTSRFHLDSVIVDAADLRRRAASLPAGLNPWSTVSIAIASVDFVKRAEVFPAVGACHWDVLVVDEAHGVTLGSDRHAGVHALAERAPYVLLLTATPHNGDRRAFSALCNVGTQREPLLVFRRGREEVSLGPGRHIHQLLVRSSAAESQMFAALSAFAQAVRVDRAPARSSSAPCSGDAWLALNILQKRAYSSPQSLAQSVARRLEFLSHVASDGPAPHQQLLLPLDPDGEQDSADEPPVLQAVLLDDTDRERHLLHAVLDASRLAAANDTKLARLRRLVTRLAARHEPAIVFTEYRDTLAHLQRHLPGPHAILHGGLDRAARRDALDRFTRSHCSLLLATDAAGEGLNLQRTCRVVIHLELPWNPMRLEQRIGRVDRIGQQRTVHAFYLVGSDSGEAHILSRLQDRVARASMDIGSPDPLTSARGDRPARDPDIDPHGDPDIGPYIGEIEHAFEAMPDVVATQMRLKDETVREHARLKRLRTLVSTRGWRSVVPSNDIWVSSRPSRKMRTLLGSRTLVVLQATAEDSCGRVIATHLTPLLKKGPGVPFFSADTLDLIDPSARSWKETSVQMFTAFWTTRVNRERAIAEGLRAGPPTLFQTGLFDQREQRKYLAEQSDDAEMNRESTRRLVALQSRLAATAIRIRPVLVVVGRR